MSHIIGYLTVDQKGRTTLPQRVREQLGLGAGAQLRIEQTDAGTFEIVPAISIPQDQAWYHSGEGRERLERAERDFHTGRVTRTSGEGEARQFLESLKTPASKGAAKGPVKSPVKGRAKRAVRRTAKR
jgi:AbrB family looped-hinge helix DNA binding protein